MSDYLQVPSAEGGVIGFIREWQDYAKRQENYTKGRFKNYQQLGLYDIDDALGFLWDGNGTNPNAALTIFRHFDSASVSYGLIGEYPETAWVIDYPLFERIHYLLVAGFNVFDNVKHQLSTRLYMNFLRAEGEDLYLSFLPVSHRQDIRNSWYEGMRKDSRAESIGRTSEWMKKDVVIGYKSNDPQRELYQHMESYLADVLERDDVINRCEKPPCHAKGADADKRRADAAMRHLIEVKGVAMAGFSDVTLVRVVRNGKREDDFAYSVIRNKAYKNVSSIFQDEEDSKHRDYEHDSLTVVDWVEGSYPNFFFSVDINEVEKFAKLYSSIKTRDDYERLVGIYGIRRTNQQFWEIADWFQDEYRREKPIHSGLLDLNRYRNR